VLEKLETETPLPEVLRNINIGPNLTEKQQQQLINLLKHHNDIFSKNDTDIGNCKVGKHRIDLHDEIPFKERYRRIHPTMIDEVRRHLEDIVASGVIRKSNSPWASPVVLCRKKNNKIRMCIDYSKLNSKTIKDSYAIPRIEDILDRLHGAKYFSTVDMKAGYYRTEIEENHKERTAFTLGPFWFWEFNKLPFGCSNSPAKFERIVEEILGEYNMTICIIYLDDLIIFSSTFEEHFERLNLVMPRLH